MLNSTTLLSTTSTTTKKSLIFINKIIHHICLSFVFRFGELFPLTVATMGIVLLGLAMLMCNKACICIHFLPIAQIQQEKKHLNEWISILNTYIRAIYIILRSNTCIYDMYIYIHSDVHPYTLTKLYIYRYMYIQSLRPNSLCASHWCCRKLQSECIMNIQSPPEATAGYYQEVSR